MRERSTRCARNFRSAPPPTNCGSWSGTPPNPIAQLLRGVAARLRATRAYAAAQIEHAAGDHGAPPPFLEADEFAAPLLVCHRSLVATGNRLIAAGRLTDILRRVAAFGLVLAPLDVRQEAGRHTRGDRVDRAGLEPRLV